MSSSFHRQANGYSSTGEPYHEEHPVDLLEPLEFGSNDVRDARIRFLEIIESWAALMHRAFSDDNPTAASVVPVCYGPMFAIGVSCLGGLGMTDIADRFNLSRQSISKQCTAFSEMHDLPPSRYTKEAEARAAYSQSRIEQVKQSGNGALPPHKRAKPFKTPPPLPNETIE
jgi:hypothetical protein